MKVDTKEIAKEQYINLIFEIACEGIGYLATEHSNVLKKQFLNIYSENEPLIKKDVLGVLNLKIPYILEINSKRRADAVKIMAVARWAFYNPDIKNEFTAKIVSLLKKTLPSIPNQPSRSEIVLLPYYGLTTLDDSVPLSLFHDAINICIKTYESCVLNTDSTEKYAPSIELVRNILNDYPRTNAVSSDNEILRNQGSNYILDFNEKTFGNISTKWDVTITDDVEEYTDYNHLLFLASEHAGIKVSSILNNALLSKQMLHDAICSYDKSLIEFEKIGTISKIPEGTVPVRSTKKKPTVAASTSILTYLSTRLILSQLEKEVKEVIRLQIFGTNADEVSKPSIEADIIKKLTGQVEQAKLTATRNQEARAQLEDTITSSKKREAIKDEKLMAAQKTIELLQAKLERFEGNSLEANEDNEELHPAENILISSSEFSFEDEDELARENQCKTELETELNNQKVLLVGGNPILIGKFSLIYPQMMYVSDKKITTCDTLIKNADLVIFKTDSMSHSMYVKCKQIAQAANIPIRHLGAVTSLSRMEREVLKTIRLNPLTNRKDNADE